MRKKHPYAGLFLLERSLAAILSSTSGRLDSPRPETGSCVLSGGSAGLLTCRGLTVHRAPEGKEYRMRGMKQLRLVLVAVVAIGALATTTAAQAVEHEGPFYKVSGQTLKAGETRAIQATLKSGEAFTLANASAGSRARYRAVASRHTSASRVGNHPEFASPEHDRNRPP